MMAVKANGGLLLLDLKLCCTLGGLAAVSPIPQHPVPPLKERGMRQVSRRCLKPGLLLAKQFGLF